MPARLLFVPVSGSAGSGEAQRCTLLASALRASAPGIESHFLLAEGAQDPGFPTLWLPASPTRSPGEVAAAIRVQRPAVVVFDGNARVESLSAAREAGARNVLLSSRPSARRRGLRGRRMALIDEHWFVGADLLGAPGWRERWARWRYPRVAIRRYATFFAPPAELEPLRARFHLGDAPYAVVSTGGGRHAGAADRFGAAATLLARDGLATLAIATPAQAPAFDVGALPNAELMALLAGARVAVLAGGSLLVQALALGTAVVASPLQAEQAKRVRWLAQAGAVQLADDGQPAALATMAQSLAGDDAARAALREGARALGLHNGLDEAVERLRTLASYS